MSKSMIFKELAADQQQQLLATLEARFAKHPERHDGITWKEIYEKLIQHPGKLSVLNEMERTGGEPDVVKFDETNEIAFCDFSAESPAGRRSVCYDREGLESRKEHRPANSAVDMAAEMGISLLNETQYREIQCYGALDTKTSSWIQTPESIRKHGGALFGDYRYGSVFIYHNGAQSYYAARGFRGMLKL